MKKFLPQPKPCSRACSVCTSLAPKRSSSSLRASSPRLEPEKDMPCLGEAVPYAHLGTKLAQISFVRPPGSSSHGVGARPIQLVAAWDRSRLPPATPAPWSFRPDLGFPCCLPRPTGRRSFAAASRFDADSRARDCIFATAGGSRALRARHLAPPTSFSGPLSVVGAKRKPPPAALKGGEYYCYTGSGVCPRRGRLTTMNFLVRRLSLPKGSLLAGICMPCSFRTGGISVFTRA